MGKLLEKRTFGILRMSCGTVDEDRTNLRETDCKNGSWMELVHMEQNSQGFSHERRLMLQSWGKWIDTLQALTLLLALTTQLSVYCWFGSELTHQVGHATKQCG